MGKELRSTKVVKIFTNVNKPPDLEGHQMFGQGKPIAPTASYFEYWRHCRPSSARLTHAAGGTQQWAQDAVVSALCAA